MGVLSSFSSFSSFGFFRAAKAFLVNSTAVRRFTPLGELPIIERINSVIMKTKQMKMAM